VQVAIPAERAACLAIKHDANFTLLFIDKIDEKTGTILIFVPSRKAVDEESYHIANFFFMSCILSKAHSMWRAYIFSDVSEGSFFLFGPLVVWIGSHLIPIFLFVINDKNAASLSSSCCQVEYRNQPISFTVLLSEAFGHRLKD